MDLVPLIRSILPQVRLDRLHAARVYRDPLGHIVDRAVYAHPWIVLRVMFCEFFLSNTRWARRGSGSTSTRYIYIYIFFIYKYIYLFIYPPPRVREWRAKEVSFWSVFCLLPACSLSVCLLSVYLLSVWYCLRYPPPPPPHTHTHFCTVVTTCVHFLVSYFSIDV